MFETAHPLENYSSLHQLSLMKIGKFKIPLFVQFDFNVNTPLSIEPKAKLVFKTTDDTSPRDPKSVFSVTSLKRWRTDISSFTTFDEFVGSLIRWHRCNYKKSMKTFQEYGARVVYVEGDWSEHVDEAYKLYYNVAKEHSGKLYDLKFFKTLATRGDYKLIAAFFEDKMVAMFVLQEELPIFHSICCGMDYNHSSKCYAYSWLHYELIRIAIDSKKYQSVDVGMSADLSKKEICFSPIEARMDIYAKGFFTRSFLKGMSKLFTATITPDAKMRFKLRKFQIFKRSAASKT